MKEKRPYFRFSINDLEALFAQYSNDKRILTELKRELAHRERPRARKLLSRVNDALYRPLLPTSPPPPPPPYPDLKEPVQNKVTQIPLQSQNPNHIDKSQPNRQPKWILLFVSVIIVLAILIYANTR